MIEKIEKDAEISKTEKKIIKYAWISILVGVIILTLGNVFEGNPVMEFLSGATPWILLGLTFLFWILSLNKQTNLRGYKPVEIINPSALLESEV